MALLAAVLVGAGCTGAGPDDGAAPATTPADTSASATDPSGRSAPALHASLTVQLQMRSHLLVELASATVAQDRLTQRALRPVLAAQRRDVVRTVEGSGGAERRGGVDAASLLAALAAEDELLLDVAGAGDLRGRLQERSTRGEVQRGVAAAAAEVSNGRLPFDVAQPIAASHLDALLGVVEAARGEGGLAAALEASHDATGRLVDVLAAALSAEAGLDGSLEGDAAALRTELASVLAHDGFARASDGLGSPVAAIHAELAAGRFDALVRRLYGTEVATHVGAGWTEVRNDTKALVAVLAEQGRRGGERSERAVETAWGTVDASVAAASSQLAGTVGERDVAPAVRAALEAHGLALVALLPAAGSSPSAASWRAATDAAVELADLATILASAISRQKGLG